MSEQKTAGAGFSTKFLSESYAELKKVSYPTKQETIRATIGALVMIFLVSIYLFGIDQIFGLIMYSFLN